jgi:hypothetical protein
MMLGRCVCADGDAVLWPWAVGVQSAGWDWSKRSAMPGQESARQEVKVAQIEQQLCDHIQLTRTMVGGFTCDRCGLYLFHFATPV